MISAKDLKDPNIPIIAQTAREVCPGSRVILFGSRARGSFDQYSDYDVLVVTDESDDPKELVGRETAIRKKLAEHLIPVDVIVETREIVEEYKDLFWTVIHDAIKEGVEL